MINSAARNHKWVGVHIAVWTLGKILFLGIKLWGIEATSLQHFNRNLYMLFTVVTLSGIVDGLVFGLIDIGLDQRYQHLSLRRRLIIKCHCNLSLALIFTFSLIPVILGRSVIESIGIMIENLALVNVLLIAAYIFSITFILQLFRLVSKWVQVNNLSERISLH